MSDGETSMRFGFDIHGVIDAEPRFFSELTEDLIKEGHEVHILTGHRITAELRKELASLQIRWTKLFSITDHHIESGTEVTFDEKGNPWIEDELWDKTKADYCKDNEIVFHIDDSKVYGDYFKTPYCRFDKSKLRFYWSFGENDVGEFLFLDPRLTKQIITGLGETFYKIHNGELDEHA